MNIVNIPFTFKDQEALERLIEYCSTDDEFEVFQEYWDESGDYPEAMDWTCVEDAPQECIDESPYVVVAAHNAGHILMAAQDVRNRNTFTLDNQHPVYTQPCWISEAIKQNTTLGYNAWVHDEISDAKNNLGPNDDWDAPEVSLQYREGYEVKHPNQEQ